MNVADARGRRWDAATGIGFVVFAIVSLGLPGAPPMPNDPDSDVIDFFTDKRSELLASAALWFVAGIFFLWFLGSLRSYLRAGEGGEGRLSAAAFGGGVVGVAMISVSVCALAGPALNVAQHRPDVNLLRAFLDFSDDLAAMSGAGFVVFFAAAACSSARSGALPAWNYWFATLAAVLQLLGLVALFAKSGAFAFGGAVSFAAPVASILWILATSIVLVRREGVPPEVRTAP